MRKLVLSILMVASVGICHAEQSKDSLDELFEVMQAEKMIDVMYQQFGGMFNDMQRQLGVTAEEAPIFEKYNKKMITLMRAEMSWAKMAPDLKQIYKQNFSESEIEGLLAFYQSPVGKSFVEKMPAISQESMMLGQTMAMNLTP